MVGNKSDQVEKRRVTFDEGYNFAKMHGMSFTEVSALSSANIAEAFQIIAKQVLKRLDSTPNHQPKMPTTQLDHKKKKETSSTCCWCTQYFISSYFLPTPSYTTSSCLISILLFFFIIRIMRVNVQMGENPLRHHQPTQYISSSLSYTVGEDG